jgi:DNA-binding NarL/FixJ family response regulator
LVVLDIAMPGIDGYETCHRIRFHPPTHGVQIVMVSAKSSREEQIRVYAAGADDYIVKPFDPYALCSRVRLHFRLRDALVVRTMEDDLRLRFDNLNSRERDALAKIVEGVPNKTIAHQLDVSHRTANRIRAAVFKKMGVASAVDLARIVGEFELDDLENDAALVHPADHQPARNNQRWDSSATLGPPHNMGRKLRDARGLTNGG